MSKFKVGDKVKFIGDSHKHISSDVLDNHKNDLTICRVCKAAKGYYAKACDIINERWFFDDDELELLEEQVDKVDSLYSYLAQHLGQPDFKLSPELEYEWENQETLYPYITDNADTYNKYILGLWENQDIEPVYFKDIKEEKEMNKVLNLWFERKQQAIIEKYSKMEQDFINNNYSVVQSYNELVAQFEKDLEDLYKFDKANEQFVLEEISDENTIKYGIDFDKLSCEFTDKHIKEKQGELKELAKIREEVEAQLSLSNKLKYQQEVLIQYNIIDKKTKKIVE